jgi:hypothetical protein
MAPNSDRFEAAYNKIDALLRKEVSRARSSAFSSVVMEAAKQDATVRAYKDDLLEHGDLRNAIVHDRGRTPFLLADPRRGDRDPDRRDFEPPFATEEVTITRSANSPSDL